MKMFHFINLGDAKKKSERERDTIHTTEIGTDKKHEQE